MKLDARKIIIGVCIAAFAVVLVIFIINWNAGNKEVNPGAGQDEQAGGAPGLEETDTTDGAIKWVSPGIDYESLRFEDAGEGLFLLEAALAGGGAKFGFMDRAGAMAIPMAYDHAEAFTQGLAYVVSGDRKLFIDPSGAEALDISEYDSGSPFKSGFAMVTRLHTEEIQSGVRQEFLQGLIDMSGNEVLPCEYSEAGAFDNGSLWAVRDKKYAMFDSSGARVTQHEYDFLEYAGEGLIIAQRDGVSGYLDGNGGVAIPFEFAVAGRFFDGLAAVANDQWLAGYVNPRGEKITPIEFESAGDFSEGRAAVQMGGLFGFIDTQGDVAIPFMYDEVRGFIGGVAIGFENFGRSAVRVTPIDKFGNTAILPKEMGYYKWNDAYVAFYDPELGLTDFDLVFLALLDDEGDALTGFYYTEISGFRDGLAVVEEIDNYTLLYGIINKNGVQIIPSIHERVALIDGGTIIVQTSAAEVGGEPGRSKVGIMALPHDAATREIG